MARDGNGQDFFVKFWGTRGSIACSGPDTIRYGGNTSCLEVMCGKRRLVFDGGTGLRKLGRVIAQEIFQNGPQEIDLFLTHTHLDHIIGLPFFVPFHLPGNNPRLWAGNLLPDRTLRGTLSEMMQAPLFPVPPETFRAKVEFRDFECGDTLHPADGITLRTAPLNHPNGACGYRIEFDGRSICYITDTEHYPDGKRDQTLIDLVRDTDIMIYDATYTEEEYPRFVGFGHSTWQEAVRVADEAGVKTLVLFHHEPTHDDEFMDDIAEQLEDARPGSHVAREGMILKP
ncbi:MBL fold metallo-hydrolase [Rhodospirillaceae bacterium KN72]|uniref:MBL fold metallo-hydrolase n=1 Tax=Pacificispira spongiicola TaxID=2729598 RepID=A0A7Y0HH26_9PROT|nr:MBL fold metallo-hydrolase [Pacificispira spongiicola]NMM45024.1 MBL fold metallo-hydrolase [Pacificispira spongiicola]